VVARASATAPERFACCAINSAVTPAPVLRQSHPGPRTQPKKSKARDLAVALRKQNHSVYEIAQALKDQAVALTRRRCASCCAPKALPPCRGAWTRSARRNSGHGRAVADVRAFALVPGTQFVTRCGGLFLSCRTGASAGRSMGSAARLPGSAMIPRAGAARRAGAEAVVDRAQEPCHGAGGRPGLALFCGLNAIPKKSYLCEYSSRLDHARTTSLLAAWHRALAQEALFSGESFNLDFHSVPYYGRTRRSSATTSRCAAALTERAGLPRPGRGGTGLLLFECRSAQGRGSRGDLPLHRILEETPRRAPATWCSIRA